jgi:hypothetical protein
MQRVIHVHVPNFADSCCAETVDEGPDVVQTSVTTGEEIFCIIG